MERMGSLDAVFVAAEDAVNHMHIGSVGIFDGPPPSYDDVRALVASKLQLVPRYRQRVREAPMSIGRPLWIDDVHFNLDYHLRAPPFRPRRPTRARATRRPGDVAAARPQSPAVGDVGDRRASRRSLGDPVEGAPLHGRRHRRHRPARRDHGHRAGRAPPGRRRLDARARAVALRPRSGVGPNGSGVGGGVVTGVADAARHPARAWGRFRDIAVGLERLVAPSRARRRVADRSDRAPPPLDAHACPLDEVKTVRRAFGGTVNDVVLAAVTRGFRELLLARGARREPDGHDAHPGVDAGVRRARDARQPGVGGLRAASGRHRRPDRAPRRDSRAHGRAEAVARDRRVGRDRGSRRLRAAGARRGARPCRRPLAGDRADRRDERARPASARCTCAAAGCARRIRTCRSPGTFEWASRSGRTAATCTSASPATGTALPTSRRSRPASTSRSRTCCKEAAERLTV